jgi:diacylglycerol kinase (ATP)
MKEIMENKPYTTKNPFKRICNAFIYSMKGFKAAFISEAAFRQDLLLALINIIVAVIFCNKIFIVWFVFTSIFLLFAELINTAIEYVVDRISLEKHPLAGSAKDVGSSLVFLAIVNIVISWSVFLIK